jgi:hypothetical protein
MGRSDNAVTQRSLAAGPYKSLRSRAARGEGRMRRPESILRSVVDLTSPNTFSAANLAKAGKFTV